MYVNQGTRIFKFTQQQRTAESFEAAEQSFFFLILISSGKAGKVFPAR